MTDTDRLPRLTLTGSSIGHVHRSLAPALMTIDEYAEQAEIVADLEAIALPAPAETPDLSAEILRRVDRGEEVDGAWLLERAAEIETADRVHKAAAHALSRARSSAVGQLDGLVGTHSSTIFAWLHGALHDLLADAVRAWPTLGGAEDAEAAIAKGKVAELTAWRELASRYVRLRNQQQLVWQQVATTTTALPSPIAYIAAPMAADVEFVQRRTGRMVAYEDDYVRGERPPKAEPWPDLRSEAALPWLVEHPESKPWVPTLRQVEQAEQKIQAVIHAAFEKPDDRVVEIQEGVS